MLSYMSYHVWNDLKKNKTSINSSYFNYNYSTKCYLTYEVCYNALNGVYRLYNDYLIKQKTEYSELKKEFGNALTIEDQIELSVYYYYYRKKLQLKICG